MCQYGFCTNSLEFYTIYIYKFEFEYNLNLNLKYIYKLERFDRNRQQGDSHKRIGYGQANNDEGVLVRNGICLCFRQCFEQVLIIMVTLLTGQTVTIIQIKTLSRTLSRSSVAGRN